MGVLFQIPVGVLAIARLRIVTHAPAAGLPRLRLILVSRSSPRSSRPRPDPFTMLIAMAPLVVLYELSILLARALRAATRAALDEAEDAMSDDG